MSEDLENLGESQGQSVEEGASILFGGVEAPAEESKDISGDVPVEASSDAVEESIEEGEATGKEERLAKFLASCGIASRRNCEDLIEEGRVTVNGEAVTSPAYNVDPDKDVICFEGRVVETHPNGKIYIIINKPVGYTCSSKDEHAERLVFDLIPRRFGRLFTVGRLDRDSEGLLILTNDGDYAQRIMHPSRQILKRYYVECEGQFSTSLRRRMIEGFYDNDEFLRALNVEEKSVQKGHCSLVFTLGEGRKREVRRLCKDVGLEVTKLCRIGIGALELDEKLIPGAWRIMTPAEQEKVFEKVYVPDYASSSDPRPYWQKSRENRLFDREHRPYMASPYPEYKKEDNDSFKGRGGFDRDRKPFDRDRKPFDRDRKPFDRDRKPFDRDRKPFDRERKPFDRDRKPFDRDRKPFDRDRKPFDRDRKPFDRDRKPFDCENERRPWYQEEEGGFENQERSFDRDRKPFDRDRKPFDRERKPFDRDRKPFDRDRKPFDRDRKPFDRDRKPFDRDRKPFDRENERRPWYQEEEGGFENQERSFDRDRKPFDRERKPFDRDRKPFDRERKPFDRDRKPFDRDRKPFDRDRKPFDRDRKPFDRDRKPFDRDRKPFDRDRKPFDREGGGFKGGQRGGFGQKRGFGGRGGNGDRRGSGNRSWR